MGKSRSATILLAYLLWSSRQHDTTATTTAQQNLASDPDMVSLPKQPLSVIKALELLRQGRPIAEPNEGFMDQLHMYEKMGCPTTDAELHRHKIYRRWLNKRSVEESLRVNMAPEMADIIFEDENDDNNDKDENDNKTDAVATANAGSSATGAVGEEHPRETRNQGKIKNKGVSTVAPGIKAPDGTSSPSSTSQPPAQQVTLKCRKCRHVLATTPFILAHVPPPHTDPSYHNNDDPSSTITTGSPSSKCAHVFLHPLSWMRPVLSEGQMEGRLSCPKCNTNIGKFAWAGLRCSCGGWVTPGFGVTRGKVDEVVLGSSSGGGGPVGSVGGGALRLPPGMRRGGVGGNHL